MAGKIGPDLLHLLHGNSCGETASPDHGVDLTDHLNGHQDQGLMRTGRRDPRQIAVGLLHSGVEEGDVLTWGRGRVSGQVPPLVKGCLTACGLCLGRRRSGAWGRWRSGRGPLTRVGAWLGSPCQHVRHGAVESLLVVSGRAPARQGGSAGTIKEQCHTGL